ncbi:uncharacterized protein CMU_025440 [Cryptosporidium muris RN66]|uniref:Uncharacterized protein n=1 Tax=Cryptosporidium muris (strain RN66) TaxID=441375 RepID=B6AAY6_CRYMR|nr:uncharacterized protein CMU_025440 [Cryptosporidium muris RN66]EEA05538.1 hypothetical protein, conserved [Cryptosporidium muris RN66]|eukprot:XP_002139887.1 hypothetical protein [Cryptosporidium muris RN66]
MELEKHLQLRNNLYFSSLKLFPDDLEWLSEYIPAVSKWKIKVLLRSCDDEDGELDTTTSMNANKYHEHNSKNLELWDNIRLADNEIAQSNLGNTAKSDSTPNLEVNSSVLAAQELQFTHTEVDNEVLKSRSSNSLTSSPEYLDIRYPKSSISRLPFSIKSIANTPYCETEITKRLTKAIEIPRKIFHRDTEDFMTHKEQEYIEPLENQKEIVCEDMRKYLQLPTDKYLKQTKNTSDTDSSRSSFYYNSGNIPKKHKLSGGSNNSADSISPRLFGFLNRSKETTLNKPDASNSQNKDVKYNEKTTKKRRILHSKISSIRNFSQYVSNPSKDLIQDQPSKYKNSGNCHTLWEYLPLVAVLNACTGIFILLRLSSAIYRFSILSCSITHIITFTVIGIPLLQMEFALRKKGPKYGLLQALSLLDYKLAGISFLSLTAVIIVFIYSCQIISTLSIILYSATSNNWKLTEQDYHVCQTINNSTTIFYNKTDINKEHFMNLESTYNAYNLCSNTAVCTVILPWWSVGTLENPSKDSEDLIPKEIKELLISKGFEYKPAEYLRNKTSMVRTTEASTPSNTLNSPIWCMASKSKKLRNTLTRNLSNYRELEYLPVDAAIKDPKRYIEHSHIPMTGPPNTWTHNLTVQSVGLLITCTIMIVIQNHGSFFHILSLLSFLSLVIFLLTATIQIVANGVQLNIFLSLIGSHSGISNLLTPAVWYCAIQNALLFFGTSFLITMVPLESSKKTSGLGLAFFRKDRFSKERDVLVHNKIYTKNKVREQKSDLNTININIESAKASVELCRTPRNNTPNLDEDSHHLTTGNSYNFTYNEEIPFPSLRSSIHASVLYLICVFLSFLVISVSNSALIALSYNPPSDSQLIPFLIANMSCSSPSCQSSFTFNDAINIVSSNNILQTIDYDNQEWNKDGHNYNSPIFTNNEFSTGSKTISTQLKGHITLSNVKELQKNIQDWYYWNFLQLKSQSMILGEYTIIYLIILAVESSQRIPDDTIVFFILIFLSYAICCAAICISIIFQHISVGFYHLYLPLIGKSSIHKFFKKDTISKYNGNKRIYNYCSRNKKKTFISGYKQTIINFFEVIYNEIKKFFYLSFIWAKSKILHFFGIKSKNKHARNFEKKQFMFQILFIFLAFLIAFIINIISIFTPRWPVLDSSDSNSNVYNGLSSIYLPISSVNAFSLNINNNLYTARNNPVIFGSLIDIQLLSSATNCILSVASGAELIAITWYYHIDVQKFIVGKKAVYIHAAGYSLATLVMSLGFLLGRMIVFCSSVLISILVYTIFFFIARHYSHKAFRRNEKYVIRRSIYKPTWWLCFSNVDILRRQWNSQELIDAGLAAIVLNKNDKINEKIYNNVKNEGEIVYSINIKNTDNQDLSIVKQKEYSKSHKQYREQFIQEYGPKLQKIADFNIYCNVRSRQPQFSFFWFIIAKFIATIFIISTIPVTFTNFTYMLINRSDCLDGLLTDFQVFRQVPNDLYKARSIAFNESIFLPLQVITISIIKYVGILLSLIFTIYLFCSNRRLRYGNLESPNEISSIDDIYPSFSDNYLYNILDDVYELLQVPTYGELLPQHRIQNYGRLPQELILSVILLQKR